MDTLRPPPSPFALLPRKKYSYFLETAARKSLNHPLGYLIRFSQKFSPPSAFAVKHYNCLIELAKFTEVVKIFHFPKHELQEGDFFIPSAIFYGK